MKLALLILLPRPETLWGRARRAAQGSAEQDQRRWDQAPDQAATLAGSRKAKKPQNKKSSLNRGHRDTQGVPDPHYLT